MTAAFPSTARKPGTANEYDEGRRLSQTGTTHHDHGDDPSHQNICANFTITVTVTSESVGAARSESLGYHPGLGPGAGRARAKAQEMGLY